MIRAAILLLCSASLSGCVAAAAIPVLAGGSMLGSEAVAGPERGSNTTPTPAPRNASPSEPVDQPSGQTGLVMTDMRELPAPTQADVHASAERRAEARSFDDFYGYALAQASTNPLEAPMRSAYLVNPGSLEPIRKVCGAREPVALVDLDPKGGLFDPAGPGRGSVSLGEVLAVFRSRGIAIAWISGLSHDSEARVRARLAGERLDTSGADRVLLLDDAHVTKQELRAGLAETHCPVAIAGDAREDFDELFAYLKNPDAAFQLNEMFGAGWFLTPNPID